MPSEPEVGPVGSAPLLPLAKHRRNNQLSGLVESVLVEGQQEQWKGREQLLSRQTNNRAGKGGVTWTG